MVTWCRFNFNCASVPLIRTHTNFPLALAHRHQHHHHRRRRCAMADINSYWIKVIFVSTQLWPLVTHFSCLAFHYISLYCMIIFRQNQLDFGSCRSLFRVATNKTQNVVPNFVERGFFYIKCRNQNDVRANAWLPFFRLYRTQALICVSVYFPSEQNNITYHQLRLHRAWWLFYYISMTHFKRDRVWCIYVKKREQVTCFPQRTHATPKPMEFYHASVSISLLFDVCGFLPPSRANLRKERQPTIPCDDDADDDDDVNIF